MDRRKLGRKTGIRKKLERKLLPKMSGCITYPSFCDTLTKH